MRMLLVIAAVVIGAVWITNAEEEDTKYTTAGPCQYCSVPFTISDSVQPCTASKEMNISTCDQANIVHFVKNAGIVHAKVKQRKTHRTASYDAVFNANHRHLMNLRFTPNVFRLQILRLL